MKNLRETLHSFKTALSQHEHTAFDSFIVVIIVLSAVLIGLETEHALLLRWYWLFHLLDQIVLWIFVLEVLLKIWAQGSTPWRYFTNAWNLFDFFIVLIGFTPLVLHALHPEYAADYHAVAALRIFRLARAIRVLRVFRLVTHLHELQVLVETLVRSFRKLMYVGLLLASLFYVYAVIGVFLFRDNDPEHFESLSQAHLTLFQCITGDSWSEMMKKEVSPEAHNGATASAQEQATEPASLATVHGSDSSIVPVVKAGLGTQTQTQIQTQPQHVESYPILAPLYFLSFIGLGSYVLLNLVVGIIISAMEQANEEHERERDAEILASEALQWQMLKDIGAQLQVIEASLQKKTKKEGDDS